MYWYVRLLYTLRLASEVLFAHLTPALFFRWHSGNVLHHHNWHLMGHFEFLNGSRKIFPLNISEKFHWQHLFENQRQRLIAFNFVNAIQYLRISKNYVANGDHHHQYKSLTWPWLVPIRYQSHTWLLSGPLRQQNPISGCNMKLIWLLFFNTLSFNFIPTPNKSHVNCPVVVPTNHCQSCIASFAWCALIKVVTFLFLQMFVSNHIAFE